MAGCALAASSPDTLRAQSSRLYVGNSIADNVSVIDLNSLKVMGDINVGPHVHGMTVPQDGTRLFTTSEGDNTLRVFDTSTTKLISQIKLTGVPINAPSRPTASTSPSASAIQTV